MIIGCSDVGQMIIECNDEERLSKHPLYAEATTVGQSAVGTLRGTTGSKWYSQVGLVGDELMIVISHNKTEGHAFVYAEHKENYMRNCPPGIDSSLTVHALGCIIVVLLLAGEWKRHQRAHVALPPSEELN